MAYLIINEAIGEKGIAIVGKMHMEHHNTRDPYLFNKSKKEYITKARRIAKVAEKIPESVRNSLKNQPRDENYYKNFTNRMNRWANVLSKIKQANAKKHNLMTINNKGGDISSKDPDKTQASAWETFHYNKNQKRMKALGRLMRIIDKKGHTDETYAAKNAENMKRVEAARKRLGTDFKPPKSMADAENIMIHGKPL